MARPLSSRASGSLQDLDQHQKDDGADRGVDDGGDDAAADGEAYPRQQTAGDERADDAYDDVADQTEAEAGNDETGEPAGDGTNDDEDEKAFDTHSDFLRARGQARSESSESAPISTASGYAKAASLASFALT